MKNQTVVLYIDVMERYRFFKRMLPPLVQLGCRPLLITAKLSVFLLAKSAGFEVHLLKNSPACHAEIKADLQHSLSVMNGYHALSDAAEIYSSIFAKLSALHKKSAIKYLFIWNGTTTVAKTLSAFAHLHHIQTRYFEISNLGERIFVDVQGTSGGSYLCSHPEILDRSPVNEAAYQAWLGGYLQTEHLPKQAANRSSIPWHALIDTLGYLFGCVKEDRRHILKLALNRVLNRFHAHTFAVQTLERPFIFVPLQVSDDSQVKLFSRYSNSDLIRQALRISREKGWQLIVKIHPAESDRNEIDCILDLSQKESFVIAGNATTELIRKAALVVVNNSTVGLQALIEEKEITVFGDAIYKNFDQKRLRAYILAYLLPADYFGNAPVPLETVQAILARESWHIKADNA
ncbi:hypothetical protein [Sulfurimonas sp. HSL3-7]|uniref:capsular polysaccharide export protein, LipB/KpsS family n=1 Tax=Sulfonitrofixus jiaomeiensis TaxID=3131938 RepID=UPI0031F81D76